MALEPVRDLIYIIPIEEVKSGLLFIPDRARQLVDQGIVKYRGPETKEVRIGDHVMFSGHAGTRMAVEGEGTLIILREIDVVAKYNLEPSTQLFSLKEVLDKIEEGQVNTKVQLGPKSEDYQHELVDMTVANIRNLFENAFVSEGLLF